MLWRRGYRCSVDCDEIHPRDGVAMVVMEYALLNAVGATVQHVAHGDFFFAVKRSIWD